MPAAKSQQQQPRAPLADASARSNQNASGNLESWIKQPSSLGGTNVSWDEAAKAAEDSFNSDELSRGRNGPNVPAPDSGVTKPKTKPAARKSNGGESHGDTTPTSKKRKAEASLEEDIAKYTQDLDEKHDPDGNWGYVDESCQKVRGKLMKLFDSGVMTKAAFCDAIATNNGTLNKFLTTKGTMGGQGSSIYIKAWIWFKQREQEGLKMPDPKKRKQTIADQEARAKGNDGSKGAATAGAASKGTSSSKGPELPDISDIYLDGEETDDVPCFDTCDEVRRKINVHMKLPGVTTAQFCRDLFAQLNKSKVKSIQSGPLTAFRNSKGPNTGAKSTVYYAACVYFEKLRIAQGKPKTEHRKNMEMEWPGSGMRRDVDQNTRVFGSRDKKLCLSQYGKLTFH